MENGLRGRVFREWMEWKPMKKQPGSGRHPVVRL